MNNTPVHFIVQPPDGFDPDVARVVWALENARARMLKVIDGLTSEVLDAVPANGTNSIGTLLYHLAVTEAIWVYKNLLDIQLPDDLAGMLPYSSRDEQGLLSALRGQSLDRHLQRLSYTREKLLEVYKDLTLEQFRQLRTHEARLGSFEVTAEFVLYQLIQHEAEHRGQIQTMIEAQGITPKNVPF